MNEGSKSFEKWLSKHFYLRQNPEVLPLRMQLCLAQEQLLYDPDVNDEDVVMELEQNLRFVVQRDQTNHRAKLKLARILFDRDAVEEGKLFLDPVIEEVEKTENGNQRLQILEMLGSCYMNPNISKLYHDHLKKAIDTFESVSDSDDNVSVRYKLAKCHLWKYRNEKNRKKKQRSLLDKVLAN